MDVVLAALPILLTLGLLMAPLPSWVAPTAGVVSSVLIGTLWFLTPFGQILDRVVSGGGTVVEVLSIIGGGMLLARVMDRSGAQATLARWLSAGAGATVASGLLMSTGVVPFLESVTGFGVSVIIGIPLLTALGFGPLRAAQLALLGLTVAPWGSMAPGTLLGAELAGVPLMDLGLTSGVFNLVAFVLGGAWAAVVAGRGAHEARGGLRAERPGLRPHLLWILLGAGAGLLLGGFVMVANLLLGTAVAGATGALVMAAAWAMQISRGRLGPTPLRELSPYLILLAGTILGQLLERTVLPGPVGAVIGSPALWSVVGALLGIWILRLSRRHRWGLARQTLRPWLGTAIPTGLYLLLGYAVAAGGLADSLAGALTSLGVVYLALAPWLGGLGGYITASNTGANAMFGSTQVAAAQSLGSDPLWVMGLQNASAGLGCLTSPARIELAFRIAQTAEEDAERLEGDGADRTGASDLGQRATRGRLLKVVMPYVLTCLAIWSVLSVLLLPGA